jgi:hypothetical protein
MVKAEDTNPLVTIDSVQESVIWLSKRCSDGKTRRYWVHFIAENGFDALSDHNAPDAQHDIGGWNACMDRVYGELEARMRYGVEPLRHPAFIRAETIATREAKAGKCAMVVGWQTNDNTGEWEPGYCPKLVAGPAFVHTILKEVAP